MVSGSVTGSSTEGIDSTSGCDSRTISGSTIVSSGIITAFELPIGTYITIIIQIKKTVKTKQLKKKKK